MEVSDFVEKPLLEKIQDLLERKTENYDVAFCVGKEKKIVRALKVILKASSVFLEKEFEEKWEVAVVKEGDGIPLPDFDPIAFELFVKLTSLDTWSLEILKALNLPPNKILNLISICRGFEMKQAERNLKILVTIFLQSFSEYKDTDDFLQLSQTNLKSVLSSDSIGIKELDVFYSAMRWADFQCSQMEVLPTLEQLREVLGDCLFEIRFPLMTCAEFTDTLELKEILTAEETIGVYGFIGSTANKKQAKNITTPRNNVQTSESKRNSGTNNSESLIPAGMSGPGSTQGLESAIYPPTFIDDSKKTQLWQQSLEYVSSPQLPAAAPLSKTFHWRKKINGFPPRNRHAAVAVGNLIYSFGGFNSGHPSYSRDVLDVFVLNTNERKVKWKKLKIEYCEVIPNQRRGHSAVAHNEFVIIFGGYDTKKERWSNLTYRFNTKTLKWDQPKATGNIPDPLWSHSAVVVRNEMLIYGGVNGTTDLYSLHVGSFRWSKIKTKGILPSLRSGHSATVHNDRFCLFFGEFNCKLKKTLNTIHSFDLNSKTWTIVETRGTAPSNRKNHCAFVHNGRMYIFGGYNGNNLNDVFCYDPETFEWKEVTPNGETPSPRSRAGCVALNDQVFIFGGAEGPFEYLDDTNVLQM